MQVLCLIFLFQSFLHAQGEEVYAYRGGGADGFATETLANATCGTPLQYYAYFGGSGDGFASEIISDNATCNTPEHFYPYFGGSGDGAAAEKVQNNACDTPFHFYAYFGGTGDGSSTAKTGDVCPIAAPVTDFVADEPNTCVGRVVKFTDTSTNKPTGWTWTFEGGTPATATTKNVDVVYNTSGVYQVKLVAVNYIGSDTMTKMGYINVVSDCSTLGTSAVVKTKMQVYPNPTKGLLYLKSTENVVTIEIFDLSGRKVMETKPNQKDSQINIERLSAGMYMMKTQTKAGVEVYKIIKKD